MLLQTPRDIGLAIRQRRKDLDLDQAGLARRVGVSRQWIIEVERGKPGAEVGLVLRTLKALGVALEVAEPTGPQVSDAPPGADVDLDEVLARARGESE